jgi:hypothetical protein
MMRNRSAPTCGMKIFFGANVGEWKEGQMFGDHEAITSKGINT